MTNPVVDIRDTGRNSAKSLDVQALSDNVITSATSATTGTIAVTANATYDVSFTQPADTSIKNLIMIANGNLVTGGSSGDDIDFDLGTAAGGGQIIDEKAIAAVEETKRRAKRVKEELSDVGEELKDVVDQSKDVVAAAKGKKRRGRPAGSKNKK